ncbi:MAG: elongation factor P [Candidatus Hepatoplasma vulgare]|nr:MAG: elongation factor P [Candidatus Hepatoplasma sp.]
MSELINVNDFKPGITFSKDGEVYIVIESSHAKSGRGQAHVKAKVRNLYTNAILTMTFTGAEKVEKAFIEKRSVHFLYSDELHSFFMDMENYEQFEIENEKIRNKIHLLVEELELFIIFYKEDLIGIELPKNISLRVVETANAVKGDTVNKSTKRAKLENNIEIDVPQFINTNDKVIINTENLKYVSKVKGK